MVNWVAKCSQGQRGESQDLSVNRFGIHEWVWIEWSSLSLQQDAGKTAGQKAGTHCTKMVHFPTYFWRGRPLRVTSDKGVVIIYGRGGGGIMKIFDTHGCVLKYAFKIFFTVLGRAHHSDTGCYILGLISMQSIHFLTALQSWLDLTRSVQLRWCHCNLLSTSLND